MFYENLARLILKYRKLVLALVIFITLACATSVPFLKFNFTPQQLFESTSDYDKLRERFAERFGREDNLTMVILEAPDVYSPEVLTYIHQRTLELRKLEEVKHADSLTTIQMPRAGDSFTLTTQPLITELLTQDGKDPLSEDTVINASQADALKTFASTEPLIQQQLVDKNGSLTTILLWLQDDIQDAADIKVVTTKIDAILEQSPPPAGVSLKNGGIPRIRVEIVESLKAEQLFFIPLTGLLYLIILIALFRRPQGALLPLGTVAIAASTTVALLVVTGSSINIINNVLPTLIFIIGISDSIHMLTRQAEEIEHGKSKEEAIVAMVKHTGVACLLTSATTAVGFISLIVADTNILKSFGWQAAAGVAFAYLATLFFIPAALSFVKPVKRLDAGDQTEHLTDLSPEALKQAPLLERSLIAIARKVLAYPFITTATGLLITAGFVYLSFSVVIDTKILEVYSDEHPTFQTTEMLEENLGGILPVEVSIEHKDQDHFKQPEPYANLKEFQDFATSRDGIIQARSLVDFHQAARQALLQDPKQRDIMPSSRQEIEQIQVLIEGPPDAKSGVRSFMTSDFSNARVLLRVEDFGAKKMIKEGGALQAKLDALFPESEGYTTYIAGDAYVASIALDSFIRDLLYSLALAIVIIFGMMTLVFRSLKMGLISVIPNITPLVITFGYMGWAGITLNTTTVIIFAISLGLAVDDTIHFLTRFNEERQRRDNVHEALLYTYFGAGRAIMLTSVLLLSGLALLLLSDFVPTNHFGRLTGLTIFGAVFGDLFLLPPILLILYRKKQKQADSKNQSSS